VACVFTTGCQGGGGGGSGGGIAGDPATLPFGGETVLDAVPSLLEILPEGTSVNEFSPIVLTFSESMNVLTLAAAFEVIAVDDFGQGATLTMFTATAADGHVLVLLPPPTGYPLGTIVVRASDDPVATDVTGQRVALEPNEELLSFGVDGNSPTTPAVVTVYPPQGSDGQSDTPQLTVVFDRPVENVTVTDASFVVTVDGGQPTFDPLPQRITVNELGAPDPRVYTWRSLNAAGLPEPLGTDAVVQLTLSPAGSAILEDDSSDALPTTVRSFTTAPIATPGPPAIASDPPDAVGIANLTVGDANALAIDVPLVGASPGDELSVFVFGESNTDEPQTIAVRSAITLPGPGPITTVRFPFSAMQNDLVVSQSPLRARFVDGALAFAFRVERAGVVTPLRVLDVDLAAAGIQDAVLDTVRPTIEEVLQPGGGTSVFHTDLAEFALVGRASELVRRVEVTQDLLDNTASERVVGSTADGVFVAAPVSSGGAQTSGSYSATALDAALNRSDPVSGTYRILGRVGPTPFAPGDDVTVEVYDAGTHALLPDARVIVHSDQGDGTYPFFSFGTTGPTGSATVPTDAAAAGALVTVDLAGYDLFTFHGVPATRLSVPLQRSTVASASASGSVVSENPSVVALFNPAIFPDKGKATADTRRVDGAAPTTALPPCVPFGGALVCPFGPTAIRARRLGVQTVLAGSFLLPNEGGFSASELLDVVELRIPAPATAPSSTDAGELQVPFLISNPLLIDEFPSELPPVTFFANLVSGIDLANLVGDATTTGVPFVTVEALVAGVPDPALVGLGLAYDQGAQTWNVRSAFPGSVAPTGFHGENGSLETDLFLSTEIRDTAGNRAGMRPRVSRLPLLPAPNVLTPASVPALVSPPSGGNSGPPPYDLVFSNTLGDVLGTPAGLYGADLRGSSGRGWHLWVVDPAAADGDVVIRVPDPADGGGTGLADGTITITLHALGLPGFAPAAFDWARVTREVESFAHSRSLTYTQP